jgi:hypothetical protein
VVGTEEANEKTKRVNRHSSLWARFPGVQTCGLGVPMNLFQCIKFIHVDDYRLAKVDGAPGLLQVNFCGLSESQCNKTCLVCRVYIGSIVGHAYLCRNCWSIHDIMGQSKSRFPRLRRRTFFYFLQHLASSMTFRGYLLCIDASASNLFPLDSFHVRLRRVGGHSTVLGHERAPEWCH